MLQVSWLEAGLHEKKMHKATMAEPFATSTLHAADEQGETQMLHAAFARCATALKNGGENYLLHARTYCPRIVSACQCSGSN